MLCFHITFLHQHQVVFLVPSEHVIKSEGTNKRPFNLPAVCKVTQSCAEETFVCAFCEIKEKTVLSTDCMCADNGLIHMCEELSKSVKNNYSCIHAGHFPLDLR